MIILWCILVTRRRHRRPAMVSLIHGKTTRSGLNSELNVAKMSTNMATTRSKSMTQQTIQSISMASSRPNRPSTLSGGSAHVTAHTGIDHDNNGYANTTNPNLLKRSATRIPSNGRRDGKSPINLTTLIKLIS